MKKLFRNYLINLAALLLASMIIPGLVFEGGFTSYLYASGVFMVINMLVVPLLKVMFLPLNLLTLGVFSWIVNVLALYLLTKIVPELNLIPFEFYGANLAGIIVPPMHLNVLMVAIVASFVIGFTSHFLSWLMK